MVTPSRASIEAVKAVSSRVPLVRLIGCRPSWSTRSLASARQIRPRPCLAMKLIASGVAICAGMTRSPSFSRSSSSTRMNMRPLRASSMICSGVAITPRLPLARNFSSLPSVSAVGFQSSSPSLRRLVGVEAGGAGEAGAAHLAGGDHVAEAVDQDRAHVDGDITLQCDTTIAKITLCCCARRACGRDSGRGCRSRY